MFRYLAIVLAATFTIIAPSQAGADGRDADNSAVRAAPVRGASNVRVITRQTVAPAAVVSRSLAEQPVHAHLVEVRVVHATTYVDPARNYSFKEFDGRGTSRSGHTALARVQQAAGHAQAQPARVIRPMPEAPSPPPTPRPQMILLRRPFPPGSDPQLPTVPQRAPSPLERMADAGR